VAARLREDVEGEKTAREESSTGATLQTTALVQSDSEEEPKATRGWPGERNFLGPVGGAKTSQVSRKAKTREDAENQ
jgi:hypothetical protein